MLVAPIDRKKIAEANTLPMLYEYYDKYGEQFPGFNYINFPEGADQYLAELRRCLKEGPTKIKHRDPPDVDEILEQARREEQEEQEKP